MLIKTSDVGQARSNTKIHHQNRPIFCALESRRNWGFSVVPELLLLQNVLDTFHQNATQNPGRHAPSLKITSRPPRAPFFCPSPPDNPFCCMIWFGVAAPHAGIHKSSTNCFVDRNLVLHASTNHEMLLWSFRHDYFFT